MKYKGREYIGSLQWHAPPSLVAVDKVLHANLGKPITTTGDLDVEPLIRELDHEDRRDGYNCPGHAHAAPGRPGELDARFHGHEGLAYSPRARPLRVAGPAETADLDK